MAGVTMLNSDFANVVTLAAGATEVAANTLEQSLVAYRPVGAHTTVGVTAYVGSDSTQSGDWGKVIVNAGRWLLAPPCGTPTPTPTVSGSTTPTPTCPPGNQYVISQIKASIVPGTTDTGNHGDDTVVTIPLPFSYTLYDQSFTSINLSSNGNAQFTTVDTTFTNQCLPWTTHNYTIYPYWDDLYLVNSGFGIFTSVSGTAPNRIFNIEWRSQYFPGNGSANFELRLYEGQTRFDVIYGTVTNGNTSGAAGASDGTNFYAAGGYSVSSGQTLAVVNRYNPGTNTWTPMMSMPQAAIMATAVYYPTTNKIFVFGGEDAASGTNYNITRIYDIATNTWTTGANMPDVHSFAAGGYIPATGKIY